MAFEVRQTCAEQFEILIGVFGGERFASHNLRSAAVHLERADGGDQHDHLRDQARVAAFDVEEFFHADVCAEAGFGDDEAVLADQFERDHIRDDGGLSVRDVGERTCMDGGGRAFEGLHQVGLDGVLHQTVTAPATPRSSTVTASPRLFVATTMFPKRLAHVFEGGGQRQHRHDLGSDGDVVARHVLVPRFVLAHADFHFAQEAVVDVDDAPPGDGGFVDIEAGKALRSSGVRSLGSVLLMPSFFKRRSMVGENLRLPFCPRAERVEEFFVVLILFVHHTRIQRGGNKVMRRSDGVDVTGQMQVEIFHRDDLRISAACRAALDAEGRSL
jgi:hypothetical protein